MNRRVAPFHKRDTFRSGALYDLATLTRVEISRDRHSDRAPDLSDVKRSAMDATCLALPGRFTEMDAGVRLPACDYEADGGGITGPMAQVWFDVPTHPCRGPGPQRGDRGSIRRYRADHRDRLRNLIYAG